jgi:phenylpyruvate tautomerase PptA (4-oxalocrotonate tautomerase family)
MPLPQLVLKIYKGSTIEQKQELAKDLSEVIVNTLGPDIRAAIEFDDLPPENLSEWEAPSSSE